MRRVRLFVFGLSCVIHGLLIGGGLFGIWYLLARVERLHLVQRIVALVTMAAWVASYIISMGWSWALLRHYRATNEDRVRTTDFPLGGYAATRNWRRAQRYALLVCAAMMALLYATTWVWPPPGK